MRATSYLLLACWSFSWLSLFPAPLVPQSPQIPAPAPATRQPAAPAPTPSPTEPPQAEPAQAEPAQAEPDPVETAQFEALHANVPAQDAAAQPQPWPVFYEIRCQLLPEKKMIQGRQTLRFTNTSQEPIPDLQFHLYMNAFKNERSTFIREEGSAPYHRQQDWGYIDIHSLLIGGKEFGTALEFIQPDDGNPHDQTTARLLLESPLQPGETVAMEMIFETKLPKVWQRTGFHKDFFLVAQWFPKLGVWEDAGVRGRPSAGWNCHQFHANSEFYADFGRYLVSIELPKQFQVGATGHALRVDERSDTKIFTFEAQPVHDFAFTASPQFKRIERDFLPDEHISAEEYQACADLFGEPVESLKLPKVRMILLLQPYHANQEERHFQALCSALKGFGLRYGPYPYATLTLVDPPKGARGAGGMEYPNFITAGTRQNLPPKSAGPAGVTIHEFGHQYWYGLVASNEFEESWLDEGFNTFSTGLIMDAEYEPRRRWLSLPPWHFSLNEHLGLAPLQEEDLFRSAIHRDGGADALVRNAWEYRDSMSYGINSYPKAALMLHQLRSLLGAQVFDRAMRHYAQTWRFRHPGSQDFQHVLEQVSGQQLDWFFSQYIHGRAVVDLAVTEIEERELHLERGYLESAEGRKFEGAARPSPETPLFTSRIRLENLGTGSFPSEISVRFADGEKRLLHWDGAYPWIDFRFEGVSRLKSVTIDPHGILLLDQNRLNQAWHANANVGRARRLAVRLALQAQSLMQLFGGAW